MKLLRTHILIILCLSNLQVYSYHKKVHTFVINYKRAEYGAMSQNWAVTFDDIGRAFFGNSGGVLEFDGKSWKLHQHKSKSAIRALYFDESSNLLYSGCYEDFGYWERNSVGELIYYSLADHLELFHFSGERIWSIVKNGDEILFQSFSTLFSYDTVSKQVSAIDPDGELLFMSKVNNQVYTCIRGRGISVYNDGEFNIINDSDLAKEGVIRFFLPHPDGIIVGDSKSGLHMLKGNHIEKWNCDANKVLSGNDVNTALVIDDDKYAIGTLKGGLFIINQKGEVIIHLDKQNKLDNNTVLGLSLNYSGDLLLAMDNGISYVDLNSTVEYIIDLDNAPSAIYSVVKHDGFIYVGTNNGVFYTEFEGDIADIEFEKLKPLPGIFGHIWKLDLLNNELICGNNDGIYKISKGKAYPLSLTGGGTDFITFRYQGELWLIESTYYKIRLHKRVGNKWVFSHLVDGFSGSCRFIEMDHAGYIWISHEIKGLNRIKLSDDLKKVVSNKKFGTANGLPTDYGLNVFTVNNRVIVTTGEEVYTYDDLSDNMLPYKKLNNALGRFKKAIRIVNIDNQHFWVITANEAAFVENLEDSIFVKQTLTLISPYTFPDKYQNISISNKSSILCLENGIAILPDHCVDTTQHKPLVISSVFNPYGGGNNTSGINLPLKNETPICLKNKNNSIDFLLTAVNFGPNKVNYQYRIVNLIDEWIDNKSNNMISLDDIPDGNYIFQARVVYSNGKKSNMVEYPFEILPI